MIKREHIIRKIKTLFDDALRERANFIKTLEEENPLDKVIGICEGTRDLAEMHDKYAYG
ncbi:MAG: hypothetical protein J7L47_00925 [Candidatus Odinarchaeota archaeon]|nr:hypothetical protein [Candidatus Odinarchaeota archaeon]